MKSIKDGKIPDVTLRYCPDWTAPNKSGRPKKAERHKSGHEEAMAIESATMAILLPLRLD
jgi:hypothetical protein